MQVSFVPLAWAFFIANFITFFAGCLNFWDRECGRRTPFARVGWRAPTYIDFVNGTAAPLTRFWLDYGGTRRPYPDVPANTTLRTLTFETHSWIVENDGGTCLGIYTAGPDLNTITIQ